MNKVYVGLDLGSSSFQQAAINQDGLVLMNRSYPTSEAKLRSAFANLRGEIHVHLANLCGGRSSITPAAVGG